MTIALLSRMTTTTTTTSSYPSRKTKMFLAQRDEEDMYNVDFYEETSIPTCSCHSSSTSYGSSFSTSSGRDGYDDDTTDLEEYLVTVASSWNPACRRRRHNSTYILPDRLPKGNEIECMPSSCLTTTSSRNDRSTEQEQQQRRRQLRDNGMAPTNKNNNSKKLKKKTKKNKKKNFVRAVVNVLSGNSERRRR